MPRKRQQQVDEPGQDSFLDIVANLVGILIILIMVIGVRATDAMVDARPDAVDEQAEPDIDVAAARQAAVAVEKDIHQLNARIKRQDLEIAYRRKERDKMFAYVAMVEKDLLGQQSGLDAAQRERLEKQNELLAARALFEDLKLSREALEQSAKKTNVIEHLPTPMAKTVFGKELHLRLKGGRLTYIPWDQLIAEMKAEAPEKIWKLRDAPRVTETLGPIGGFRMKYTLRHARRVSTDGRTARVHGMVELDRFILVPVQDDLGEPLAVALQPNSKFETALSQYDPNRTTITVWVYSDSFEQFRDLKSNLFRRGYLTAGRPMPDGHPIGGSPDGSRSAAQ